MRGTDAPHAIHKTKVRLTVGGGCEIDAFSRFAAEIQFIFGEAHAALENCLRAAAKESLNGFATVEAQRAVFSFT